VKADAREIARPGKKSNKFMREAVRLKRLAVHLADDVGLVAEPDPDPQKLFCLSDASAPQLLHE